MTRDRKMTRDKIELFPEDKYEQNLHFHIRGRVPYTLPCGEIGVHMFLGPGFDYLHPFPPENKKKKYNVHMPQTVYLHREIQQILLERPRLVSDHFYLATSITSPNQSEAKDIGHLKYMLYFQDSPMLLVPI